MRAYVLAIVLLAVVAFSFATTLEPWHQTWEGSRSKAENVIQVALGDSRQLFARHFFLKADAYFHNGYHPTIYDRQDGQAQAIAAQGQSLEEEKASDFLGPPRDWLEAFGRNFFPSRHTHLGDSGCGHSCCQRPRAEGSEEHPAGKGHPADGHGHGPDGKCDHNDDHEHEHEHEPAHGSADAKKGADEREILPWLKLALELDPKRVQTYVVASYWLRTSLKEVDQAERLLRDGLRQVPGNPEMLFELGRVLAEDRADVTRARNLWELALQRWNEVEARSESPNFFLGAQILGNLATLEEKAGNKEAAIRYLRLLSAISPNKESIAKWIKSLE
jgi:tetratricopeptide (TPR) repeat protein